MTTVAMAALLRGIGPGNPNMTNDKLRGVFERLGFEQVASVLSSGNIVFATESRAKAATLEDRIQQGLHEDLGIRGGTILRTHAELRALLDTDPFEGLKHGRGTYLTATFLKQPAAEAVPVEDDPLTRIVGYDADARAVLAVTDNSTPGQTPDFMARVEKAYGKDVTTRTWLTVERVVTKLEKISG